MKPATRPEPTAVLGALRRFARAKGVSEDLAVGLYDREVDRLAAEAKIPQFVGILAEKRARDALRRMQH